MDYADMTSKPSGTKRIDRLRKELDDNPRTIFQCIARGCDGCIVCMPVRPLVGRRLTEKGEK